MQQRYVIYAICWLATVTAGYASTLVSVYLPLLSSAIMGSAEPEVIGKFGSIVGGSFLAGWALGAMVLGWLTDVLGRKKTLILAIALNAGSMLLSSFVSSMELLAVVRFINGMGAGAILLVTAVIVAEEFANDRRRTIYLGILINAFPVGFILAGLAQGKIATFAEAALVGSCAIILAACSQFVVRDSRWRKQITAKLGEYVESDTETVETGSGTYRRDLITAMLLFGCMLVGLWAAYAWMPTWVSSISSPEEARAHRSMVNILLGIGAITGGIISGFVSEWLGRRKAAAVGYIGVTSVSIVLFTQFTEPTTALFALTFGLSLFVGFNQGVLTGYIPELFATRVRGRATGVAFNAGRVVTAGTVFSIGALVQIFNKRYDLAMLTFASAYIVGLIALWFARETHGNNLPD